jgi:hypothetical protein
MIVDFVRYREPKMLGCSREAQAFYRKLTTENITGTLKNSEAVKTGGGERNSHCAVRTRGLSCGILVLSISHIFWCCQSVCAQAQSRTRNQKPKPKSPPNPYHERVSSQTNNRHRSGPVRSNQVT